MLRVGLVNAKPGMELAVPVYHPKRPGTILLRTGMTLDAHCIERLRDIQLHEVWVRHPGLAFIADGFSPVVMQAHADLTCEIATAFDAVASTSSVKLDYSAYRRSVTALLDKLLSHPVAAVFVHEMHDRDRPLLRHSSSVCMMSLLMGLRLGDYMLAERQRATGREARDVSNLGVGAMLHDLGMLKLPAAVLDRWNRKNDDLDPEWRRHAALGFEMVQGCVEPTAAASVLNHHQKFDGSGFPAHKRLDGTERPVAASDIHIFARIIAAADLFDRMRHPTAPGSRPAPVVRALGALRAPSRRKWVDPMVYRALLAVVPAYAPGTQVTLSNGERAVVTEWSPQDPCRPTVQILAEDDGPPNPPRRALRDDPSLTVVEVDGEDVSSDNFYPERPGEFDLGGAGRNSAAWDLEGLEALSGAD